MTDVWQQEETNENRLKYQRYYRGRKFNYKKYIKLAKIILLNLHYKMALL